MRVILLSLVAILFTSFVSMAQVKEVNSTTFKAQNIDWQHKDLKKDKFVGVGTEKLYSEILDQTPSKETIIVAIIDGGVDVEHEDFVGKIWVNEDEIPNNNIDDDNNGYVDDINGWNFVGNKAGESVNKTTLQMTRTFVMLSEKYKDAKDDGSEDFKLYQKVKAEYNSKYKEESASLKGFTKFFTQFQLTDSIVCDYLKKEQLTYDDVKSAISTDTRIQTAIDHQKSLLKDGLTKAELTNYLDHYKGNVDYYYNTEFNPRKDIIGDDLSDVNDKDYGNSDVEGPNGDHGTMVAGLVGAKRNNGIGINGIAENVKIMGLRVVPDGDEYDKDVALSIRYAVDNGAKIINMSFGKSYSPEKEMVWDAMQYAASKNVLMIKASGNEALDIDVLIHYPTAFMPGKKIDNVITVGASGLKRNKELPAIFSNYGLEGVDIFAPGVDIISVYPGNKYKMASGTSFASPVVTGVAALILSYFPELSAKELKEILIESSVDFGKRKVYKPGRGQKKREKMRFRTLSQSGGIVNVYEAYQLALSKRENKK